jgi:rubrerythrin
MKFKEYLIEDFDVGKLRDLPLDVNRKDMQILRQGIQEEFKAIDLYEQLASITNTISVRKLLLDIANEEKTHIGEFKYLLEIIDPDHERKENDGEKESEELLKGIK